MCLVVQAMWWVVRAMCYVAVGVKISLTQPWLGLNLGTPLSISVGYTHAGFEVGVA